MMTGEAREQKAARWLEHLRAWRAQGGSLSAYAREAGLPSWEAYRWRRILRRDGHWSEEMASGGVAVVASRSRGTNFARVRLPTMLTVAGSLPLQLRLELTNGRRVELTLSEVTQLGPVLALLERAA